MKYEIHSLEETAGLAARLADKIRGTVTTVCLDGDLGAGKTTFTKSLAKGLGVKNTVNSPTFTIMKPYKMEDGRTLYHMDAYRLEGISQDLGFEECFEDGICVVEWSHFMEDQIPANAIHIDITVDGDTRIFDVQGVAL